MNYNVFHFCNNSLELLMVYHCNNKLYILYYIRFANHIVNLNRPKCLYNNTICFVFFSCTFGHYDRAQSTVDYVPLRTGRQRSRGKSIILYIRYYKCTLCFLVLLIDEWGRRDVEENSFTCCYKYYWRIFPLDKIYIIKIHDRIIWCFDVKWTGLVLQHHRWPRQDDIF